MLFGFMTSSTFGNSVVVKGFTYIYTHTHTHTHNSTIYLKVVRCVYCGQCATAVVHYTAHSTQPEILVATTPHLT